MKYMMPVLISLAMCAPVVDPACSSPPPEEGRTVPTMMSVRHPDVQLARTGDGTLRTMVRGEFVAGERAMRFFSEEQYRPPYVWTGRFRIHERLANGWPRWDGKPVTYDHSLVFHPATMPDAPGSSNWNNLVFTMYKEATVANGGIGGISAELHDPAVGDSVYGARTGYVSRARQPYPAMDNDWHDFTVEVDSPAEYRLIVDGVTLLDVVEKEPTSMQGDRFAVGLRVDAFDIEFNDLLVEET